MRLANATLLFVAALLVTGCFKELPPLPPLEDTATADVDDTADDDTSAGDTGWEDVAPDAVNDTGNPGDVGPGDVVDTVAVDTAECSTAADCPEGPASCYRAACIEGVCDTEPAPSTPCDDGELCTTDDICGDDGTCTGTLVNEPLTDDFHLGIASDFDVHFASFREVAGGQLALFGHRTGEIQLIKSGLGILETVPLPAGAAVEVFRLDVDSTGAVGNKTTLLTSAVDVAVRAAVTHSDGSMSVLGTFRDQVDLLGDATNWRINNAGVNDILLRINATGTVGWYYVGSHPNMAAMTELDFRRQMSLAAGPDNELAFAATVVGRGDYTLTDSAGLDRWLQDGSYDDPALGTQASFVPVVIFDEDGAVIEEFSHHGRSEFHQTPTVMPSGWAAHTALRYADDGSALFFSGSAGGATTLSTATLGVEADSYTESGSYGVVGRVRRVGPGEYAKSWSRSVHVSPAGDGEASIVNIEPAAGGGIVTSFAPFSVGQVTVMGPAFATTTLTQTDVATALLRFDAFGDITGSVLARSNDLVFSISADTSQAAWRLLIYHEEIVRFAGSSAASSDVLQDTGAFQLAAIDSATGDVTWSKTIAGLNLQSDGVLPRFRWGANSIDMLALLDSNSAEFGFAGTTPNLSLGSAKWGLFRYGSDGLLSCK